MASPKSLYSAFSVPISAFDLSFRRGAQTNAIALHGPSWSVGAFAIHGRGCIGSLVKHNNL